MFIAKLKQSWTWVLALAAMVTLLAFAVGLERPVGALEGRIAIEQQGFNLASYDIRGQKVYALAIGPRGDRNVLERGVWVNPDGSFRIERLPVGEYALRVRAPGFATENKYGLYVDEGRIHTVAPIRLHLLAPSVNLASNTRVFTTKEQPSFWINASGANRAVVKLYRRDALPMIQNSGTLAASQNLYFSTSLNLYKPTGAINTAFINQTPIEVFERKLETDFEDWARTPMKLAKPLPVGDYFAVAEVYNFQSQQDWNAMWFSVTDVGLVIKHAPEKAVVRAVDLNTLKPRPGVNVALYASDFQTPVAPAAQTDANGLVEFPVPKAYGEKSYTNFLAVGTHGQERAYGGISFYRAHSDKYRTYFYTERPVYRLGQTVYFKGMVRVLDPDGLHLPEGSLPVHVAVEDPDGTKIWEGPFQTNGHGTFNGTFTLPEEAKTGAYQVSMRYPDNTYSYAWFEVAQYRKPEYQVEVIPIQSRAVVGDTVKARVRATYYFGAPVTHAKVHYSVYESVDWAGRSRLMNRPEYESYYDSWDPDMDSGSYDGDLVTEGYIQTDENGEAIVEFRTHPPQKPANGPYGTDFYDKRYKIQADVTDLSRMTVVGSGTLPVSMANFAVFIKPSSEVVRQGEAISADVMAVDYEGRPVANQTIDVSLVRWIWDIRRGEYRSKQVPQTASVKTDESGKAHLTLQTDSAGMTDVYYLTAVAQDQKGRPVFDEHSVWIASPNQPYLLSPKEAQQQALSVRLDKSVYQPGETAKIMVAAPVTGKEGTQALLAIEGTRLHEYRLIDLDASAKLVEVPLKAEYEPNVNVTVTYVGQKHQFYTQSHMIKVTPHKHFLQLAVQTDKPKYHPGDEVTLRVHAQYPDGKPAAKTELSIGVVDESIYAIRADQSENIQQFFYDERANWVTTTSSFPEEYSGGPDKIEPRMRKDFRDVAAWFPTAMTDENGDAIVTFRVPDNLTTWRATVRGITQATDVGSAIGSFIATQDLIVRLALPRFFTQWDEGVVTAIVHNYTEHPQDIQVALSMPSLLTTKHRLVQTLNVKPEGAQRITWPVSVQTPGQATFQVKAIGQTAGDALEKTIPILPLGMPVEKIQSGTMTLDATSVSLPVTLPPGVAMETVRYHIALAASTLGPVIGSFDALIDYPYGCTEQTMSRLIPSILAIRLNQTLNVPLSDSARARFEDVYRKGIARLREMHHGDGGWGWWEFDESQAQMTAYVLEGLMMLRQAGYAVDDDLVSSGREWLRKAMPELQRQLSDPKLAKEGVADARIDLAMMAHAASLHGDKVSDKLSSWAKSRVSSASPEELAYWALAFHKANQSALAKLALSELMSLAHQSGELMDWDNTPQMRRRLEQRQQEYTYRFTGVERTALALRALLAVSPDNTGAIEATRRWLLTQRGKDGWDNTKTTSQVLQALMAEAIHTGGSAKPEFLATLRLMNDVLAEQSFNAANAYGPEILFKPNLAQIVGQELTLLKEGIGRLFYASVLSYMHPLKPGDTVKEPSRPEGLRIYREFFRLEAQAMTSDGKIHFRTKPLGNQALKAGETVLMKVFIESPITLPYILLEAALPSGGEVIMNDPRLNTLDEEQSPEADSDITGDWGTWWWEHQDVLDDRVVFFATQLPAGKTSFHTMIRMEMPGTFQMNPARLEGMYTRNIRAYSDLNHLRVTE